MSADLHAALTAILPRCYVGAAVPCSDFIGGTFDNGAVWTEEMCCLPCRGRRLLAAYPATDAAPCVGGDPTCPSQDGDLCHYLGDDPMLPARCRHLIREAEQRGAAAVVERVEALADEWDAKGNALWGKWPGGHAPRSEILAAGHHLHATDLRAAVRATEVD